MEKDEERLLQRRIEELAEKADIQNRFTYTDFLGLGELNVFHQMMKKISYVKYELFGGHEACERQMVRFGDKDSIGYGEEFPISCVKIRAAAPKYSEKLTHRDYLGALLNLGIQRKVLGDIFVSKEDGVEGSAAYIFCEDSIADYICEEIHRVRHTAVRAEISDGVPESELPQPQISAVQISSERIDSVVASAFKLSRGKSQELFRAGKVFVDGVLCENSSKVLKPGAVISLRGFGRVVYEGVQYTTKKGKLSVQVQVYK